MAALDRLETTALNILFSTFEWEPQRRGYKSWKLPLVILEIRVKMTEELLL